MSAYLLLSWNVSTQLVRTYPWTHWKRTITRTCTHARHLIRSAQMFWPTFLMRSGSRADHTIWKLSFSWIVTIWLPTLIYQRAFILWQWICIRYCRELLWVLFEFLDLYILRFLWNTSYLKYWNFYFFLPKWQGYKLLLAPFLRTAEGRHSVILLTCTPLRLSSGNLSKCYPVGFSL